MGDRWIEKELERQLAPVAAPGSLWDRITGGRARRELSAACRMRGFWQRQPR